MKTAPILPADVRSRLPDVVQVYVTYLEAHILELGQRLADVEARLNQHSGNSSRPPSSDSPAAPPRPKQQPSERPRGAQKGHVGHTRIQLQSDQIAETVQHRPTQCPSCTLPLDPGLPTEGDPIRQQVWEIPPPIARVSEHEGYRVRCPHCAVLVPAPDLPEGAFGPRLSALVSVLHGRLRLSMRETAGFLEDVMGVPIGVGSVASLCQETNAALTDACDVVARRVETAAHVNVDETGWKQAGSRRWLWTAVAANCTRFVVAAKRSAAILPLLLGERFAGRVTSDRYAVYRTFPTERRQICLCHLQRNVLAFAQRGGPVGDWGKAIQATLDEVFVAWHAFTDEGRDRDRLIRAVAPLQVRVHDLLDEGNQNVSWSVRYFCSDVSAREAALWTFVTTDGVEPTNNAAERALRPAVLWRKGCFGADSDDGNVFVARILTVRETCRQQQRHLLSFLTETVIAYRNGLSPPLLLAGV